MAELESVPLTSKKLSSKSKTKDKCEERFCVIHNIKHYGEIKPLTQKRWDTIQEAKKQRCLAATDKDKLALICERIPSEFNSSLHGFHDYCYNSFINLRDIRKRHASDKETSEQAGCSSGKRVKQSSSAILLPAHCLFCERSTKWISGTTGTKRRDKLVKCVTRTAEISVKEAVDKKGDLKLKRQVENIDLIAREAWYHDSCRKAYTRKEDRHLPKNITEKEKAEAKERQRNQTAEEEAHKKAFNHVCQYVEEHVFEKAHVIRMTLLKEMYCNFMQSNFPQFYNKNYKTDKLKDKLISTFQSKIRFWQRYAGTSDLVYSDEIQTGQAVGVAFENATSEERTVIEAAMIIRRAVIDGFREGKQLPWPPADKDLRAETVELPKMLSQFLTVLYSKDGKPKSTRCQRRVLSTGQDICYNVSKGEWKMPKHILLGICVRHLTGSSQLINILNRHGHSVSHSFILELETAMCDSIQATSDSLPPSIMPDNNVITHFCWDNFDLNEETPSGAGTTHSTHGIVIQEIKEQPYIPQPLPEVEKTKRRSISFTPQQLDPCFFNSKVEPTILTQTVPSNKAVDLHIEFSNFTWMFSRCEMNEDGQSIPSWNGWVSKVSESEDICSVVDYMEPLTQPITDHSTVQEVLKISQEGSKAVGQQYTFITFDLAVAKMAYSLVWQNKLLYNNVIIHLGVFHILCAYMKAIGKMISGTGFEEIVIDSKICASGSIEKILNGKHYNRSLRVHKAVLEALERLLFNAFRQHAQVGTQIDQAKKELKKTLSNLRADSFDDSTSSLRELAERYFHFKQDVRQGKLGQTGQFWMLYMDAVWNVLHCLRATKINDLNLHITSLEKMCPLFFSMDHPNYARYLTAYILLLLNLNESHPGAERLLKLNGFSVNRSAVPGARNAVDLTIEQTINRQAKCKGGIVGFSQNVPAYHKWCLTRHKRAGFVSVLREETGLDSKDDAHRDSQPSQMRDSEKSVKKLLVSFQSFTNPFDIVGNEKLISLSSGVEASEEVTTDLLTLEKEGKKQFRDFIQKRLIEKSESFHAPLKKNKKKTFTSQRKTVNVKTSKKTVVKITAQRNLFGQLLMLSTENDLDLQKVMEYPLGPFPWALATTDGMPTKTNKAVLMHKLEEKSALMTCSAKEKNVYIIDGNALFHGLSDLPETFGEVAQRILCSLPKSEKIHFVTDNYTTNSIKSLERIRRGESQPYTITGPSTKIPKDWKLFLTNDNNKRQFSQFLLAEWQKDSYAMLLQNRQVCFAVNHQCFSLTSADGEITDSLPVPNLASSHEEADTLLILHGLYVDQDNNTQAPNTGIIIRSPDTDVFLLLIAFCEKFHGSLYFDTGAGNKRRLIHMQTICENIEKHVQESVLGLHAFTGCDVTSAFVQKGKAKPLKLLLNFPEYAVTFKTMGQSETVSDDLLCQLEKFVCHLYGKPSYTSTNKLRYDLVRHKYNVKGQKLLSSFEGFDISLLPPCREALKMHALRANHQALIWKQADIAEPEVPNPETHGWRRGEHGLLLIDWCKELVPQQLVDILPENERDEELDSNDEEILQSEMNIDPEDEDVSDSESSEEEDSD